MLILETEYEQIVRIFSREKEKKNQLFFKLSLSTFLVADHAIFFTVQQKAKRTYVHAGACLQPRLTTRSPFTRVYVGHQS